MKFLGRHTDLEQSPEGAALWQQIMSNRVEIASYSFESAVGSAAAILLENDPHNEPDSSKALYGMSDVRTMADVMVDEGLDQTTRFYTMTWLDCTFIWRSGERADRKLVKPPLGLRPRAIVATNRLAEINAAVERYQQVGRAIPKAWLVECYELELWLLTNPDSNAHG